MELAHVVAAEMPSDDDHIEIPRNAFQSWAQYLEIPGSGLAMIKRRLKRLADKGVLRRQEKTHPRAKDILYLEDITPVMQLPAVKRGFDDHRKERRRLEDKKRERALAPDIQRLENDLMTVGWSFMLWVDVLPVCFRTSALDPRSEIYSRIHIPGRGECEVKTTSQTGSAITTIDDERTIKALLSLVAARMEESHDTGEEILNQWDLDIVDLCDSMGLKPTGGNRDTVRDSIYRLADTMHTISMSDEAWERTTELHGEGRTGSRVRVTFLKELTEAEERIGKTRRPRYFRFELSTAAYQGLLEHITKSRADEQRVMVFIHNPAVLRLSGGVLHRLYDWAAAHCTRSAHSRRPRVAETTLTNLWDKGLLADLPYRLARHRILKAIRAEMGKCGKTWADEGTNTLYLSGYWLSVYNDLDLDDWVIEAFIDTRDPFIGESSVHNRLSRLQTRREDASATQCTRP